MKSNLYFPNEDIRNVHLHQVVIGNLQIYTIHSFIHSFVRQPLQRLHLEMAWFSQHLRALVGHVLVIPGALPPPYPPSLASYSAASAMLEVSPGDCSASEPFWWWYYLQISKFSSATSHSEIGGYMQALLGYSSSSVAVE